jgi:hypothetical protein
VSLEGPGVMSLRNKLGAWALSVKAARKALQSGLLCSSAIFWAISPIDFSIQYISLKKHHQKRPRADLLDVGGEFRRLAKAHCLAITLTGGDGA